MSSPTRRSARIAAQQNKPIMDLEPPITPPSNKEQSVYPPNAPKKQNKRIQRLPKNLEASTTVKKLRFEEEPVSNFQYTVDWIQKVRYQLSQIANDLENHEQYLKVIDDLVKDEPWGWNSVNEWTATLSSWFHHWNTKPYHSYDLVNDREAARNTLQTCYETLKREEQNISDEVHDESYYYPPQVPTEARKERTKKIVERVKEFLQHCRNFNIKFTNNTYVDENMIRLADDTNTLLREGCPILVLEANLTPDQITNVLSFSKRFSAWEGEYIGQARGTTCGEVNKYGKSYIAITLE